MPPNDFDHRRPHMEPNAPNRVRPPDRRDEGAAAWVCIHAANLTRLYTLAVLKLSIEDKHGVEVVDAWKQVYEEDEND